MQVLSQLSYAHAPIKYTITIDGASQPGYSELADLTGNGAAYEARTRYLHLGKVALYQMS